MNAPATITLDPLHALALDIIEHGTKKLDCIGAYPFYEEADWLSAAHYLSDTNDTSELSYMIATEYAFDRFREWQARGQYLGGHEAERREFTDFDDWREGR